MEYCNIYMLALSVLKLYFDARKINKTMQNELFKRSNTNARRELGLNNNNNTFFSYLACLSLSSRPGSRFVLSSYNDERCETRAVQLFQCNEQVYVPASNVTSIACWLPFKCISFWFCIESVPICVFSYRNVLPLNVSFLITFAMLARCFGGCCCWCCCCELCLQFVFAIPYACSLCGRGFRSLTLIWFPFSHTCEMRQQTNKTKRQDKKNTTSSPCSLQAKSHDFYT